MASKIKILTDLTINKIAAGEVIANPASAVKELVENSIDAGADDICIEIKGGGRQLIRISDNGCGMNADDALLCLERHATSKIREMEDIESITTMGFRGEAIPSIASISKFTLLTCVKSNPDSAECNTGTMVIVDGGKILNCSPAARSSGTTIEVKSLFFNVPVRKKFLKSPAVDTNEILKTISMIALGYPHLKFQLISDSKTLLTTPLSYTENFEDRFKARIEAVLGMDFLQNTIFVKHEKDGMNLQGVAGLPGYTRHNRTGQYLFINQRGVSSPLIAYAVKEGYGTTLVSNRYPVFVLHLSLSGTLVDVNVHPQKKEVRLRQEQTLKHFMIQGIANALQQNPARWAPDDFYEISPVFNNSFKSHTSTEKSPDWTFDSKPAAYWSAQNSQIPFKNQTSVSENFVPPFTGKGNDNHEPPAAHSNRMDIPQQASLFQPVTTSAPPRVMATISRYILLDAISENQFIARIAKKDDETYRGGLVLIDQKAAHSRIIFEKLQQHEKERRYSQQTLLIPYTIEVSIFEASLLREALPKLHEMAIDIQEFGNQTFLVHAIPECLCDSNLGQLLSDIIHALGNEHGEQPLQDERSRCIALAASRCAVSADKRLSIEEAQRLINQLNECLYPYQCPQGKPTYMQLTAEELAKHFQISRGFI